MGDGSLYLPDDVMAELDWVVASLHVAQRQAADRITKRLIAAAEHPCVDVIGHPSGRLIGKRDGYDFDVEALIATCAAHGTFLEINSQPHRLDLRPAHARLALAAGVRLVISTDAHRLTAIDYQELGVFMARRAGATRDDIVNARPLAELVALRKPGQGRADVSDPDRSSEGLVFVSTGRRLAAAKVGRRWHEVRGPLMIAAALASIQALLLFVVLRMLQDSGVSLALVRADRGAHHARAGRLAGARARTPSDGSCRSPRRRPQPSWRRSRPCAGALRGGFDAASAQVVAYEIRERLGYARRVGVRPRARARARRARRRPPRRGPSGAARRRRRDDRAARVAAPGRLEARLRRPRLPAAVGHRRADRQPQRRRSARSCCSARRRSRSRIATARSRASWAR